VTLLKNPGGNEGMKGYRTPSQKEFSQWEEEHRQKLGKKGEQEQKEIQSVKKCVSLAVKGGFCLIAGLIGICSWPFFCTLPGTESLRTFFVVPFSLLAIIGMMVLILAGIKLLSSRNASNRAQERAGDRTP
jgi:hypothetical protein